MTVAYSLVTDHRCPECGYTWNDSGCEATSHSCPRCKIEWEGYCNGEHADQTLFDVVPRSLPPIGDSVETAPKGASRDVQQTAFEIPDDKPPYRIPLMTEIASTASNGYRVVSTFSGCGGSCLGFRMAGFHTLFASEFVPAAAATYRANFPDVYLSTADVRDLDPDAILARLGLERGELDVLEGSPPCAAFSMSGKRDAGWGEVRKYSDVKQRVDDLFLQYVRILEGLQPKVFVAENVPGLLVGKARGYFNAILDDLVQAGYRVEPRVLDASRLGVPQRRRRVIFIGVRNDLGLRPAFPDPLPYSYSIRDALPYLSGDVTHEGGWREGKTHDVDGPAPAVMAAGMAGNSLGHLRVESATLRGPASRERNHRDREMPLDEPMDSVRAGGGGDQTDYWLTKKDRDAVSIERFAIGKEWDKLSPGQVSDRYLNLIRPDADKPLPTVTGSGGILGAAAVTHPSEKRKFTIAELRALCGFPDDFILTGSYSQQWERLGRAVPPPMMAAVARTIREEILDKL